MFKPIAGRIPVMAGPRLLEMADRQRVRMLLQAPNVRPIKCQRTIVELQILGYGDDANIPFRWGNPQQFSTDSESYDNPVGVWRFKRLHGPVD